LASFGFFYIHNLEKNSNKKKKKGEYFYDYGANGPTQTPAKAPDSTIGVKSKNALY
jgi:hypothetical protein